MAVLTKRATIYFDPQIHRTLKMKSVEVSKSLSELINDIIRKEFLEDEADLINGLTGMNISNSDLIRTGEKIAAIEKLFNIRHSKGDIKDRLPEMFFNKDKSRGLTRENFETMLQEYYQAMGWYGYGCCSGQGRIRRRSDRLHPCRTYLG